MTISSSMKESDSPYTSDTEAAYGEYQPGSVRARALQSEIDPGICLRPVPGVARLRRAAGISSLLILPKGRPNDLKRSVSIDTHAVDETGG
jgi:hypothetical protein